MMALRQCKNTFKIYYRESVLALPVEDIALLEVHELTQTVSTEEKTDVDDNRIAASTCDGTAAVQVHFQDEITPPVEKVSSCGSTRASQGCGFKGNNYPQ